MKQFRTLVSIIPADSHIIDNALESEISDFEDAIQFECALIKKIPIFITRNIKDFKHAKALEICTPEMFLTKYL